ncbi:MULTISPECIES: hypothetical protein [unclassified Carboxylicivirga]|uniref:hypothetical protein n=1 Tax=Carboxylicivirga TaxID=1628153 RepID=UPI003D34F29E
MKLRCLFASLGLILFCGVSWGQLDMPWRYYYPEFNQEADKNLYFRLENNNFFDNNEYFGEYIEGYTMIGYTAHPSFIYYASPRVRIQAGVYLTKFSGIDEFEKVLPTFSIHTRLSDRLDLIMGRLRGDVHHRMLEPLFNPENQYTRPFENGIQFVYEAPCFRGDLWIDWEQFIKWGDTKPEKFTAGFSANYRLNKPGNDWELSIPAQVLVTHLGGQISDYEERMQSLANLATGLKLNYRVGDGFIRSLGLATYAATYHDLTNASGYDFTFGNAWYPVAEANYKYGTLMAGYWHATNFLAPKGSPLFQSASNYQPDYFSKTRELISAKLNFSKTLLKQLKLNAIVQLYYDLPAAQLEYSYGINLMFTPNFFISKINFE